MTYILFVWTVVAATTGSSYKDWRPMGEFYEVYPMKAKEVCESAAKQLGYKDEKYTVYNVRRRTSKDCEMTTVLNNYSEIYSPRRITDHA